ncbi:MAG: lytic murein transglycosylase [Patescibacteria group bacterium]
MRQFFLATLIFGLSVFLPLAVGGLSTDEVNRRKAALEAELRQVETEIAIQNNLIAAKQREVATFERDREILNSQIAKAKLVIKAHQLETARLGGDIKKKVETISELTERIERNKNSLAELLRQRRDLEEVSLVETIFNDGQLSDFFHEVDQYQYVEDTIHDLFATTRATRAETENLKQALEERRSAEIDAEKLIEQERRRVERKETEKREMISTAKNQTTAYKKVLASRQKRKTEIKSALFRLRGSDSITFGTALEHANFISSKTGVRPAFLLAIITQESNLGANVGTCNRPGDPPNKHWSKILKPERDQAPFLRIVRALGLDPEIVPLSCPQGGGWGGAMGPAQFIPSTWELYQNKVVNVTGNQPPNPWTPRDAFTASSIYLKELGGVGSWTAERTAALKYYAGSRWNLPKNAFYGNEVMKIAGDYQELIDTLQDN